MVTDRQEILKLLEANRNKVRKLGVNRVGLFGSFVRGEQTKSSDIDLLVEFDPKQKTYRNFLQFVDLAEVLLGRKIELVTKESLSPYIAPHIEQEIKYVQIS